MESFKIFIPTYKRPGKVFTHVYLPEAIYVVAAFEAEEYRKTGVNVWEVPDSAQGNLCRIRNYILDHADTGRLLILDDDLKCLGRWNGNVHKKLSTDEAMQFIEHGFNLAEEMGVHFWGVNCIQDKGSYREYTPFGLTSYIGGPFQAFVDCPLRYDESLPLKEDYDLSLQVLNKYRMNLRFNMVHYFAKQHTNEGGCATYRTMEREKEQLLLLQKKWGSRIVRTDSGNSHVRRKKQVTHDINPIIKIPILGV